VTRYWPADSTTTAAGCGSNSRRRRRRYRRARATLGNDAAAANAAGVRQQYLTTGAERREHK